MDASDMNRTDTKQLCIWKIIERVCCVIEYFVIIKKIRKEVSTVLWTFWSQCVPHMHNHDLSGRKLWESSVRYTCMQRRDPHNPEKEKEWLWGEGAGNMRANGYPWNYFLLVLSLLWSDISSVCLAWRTKWTETVFLPCLPSVELSWTTWLLITDPVQQSDCNTKLACFFYFSWGKLLYRDTAIFISVLN